MFDFNDDDDQPQDHSAMMISQQTQWFNDVKNQRFDVQKGNQGDSNNGQVDREKAKGERKLRKDIQENSNNSYQGYEPVSDPDME